MQIHLIGPNRPPTLGERIVAGMVLLAAFGSALLLLSVGLVVGLFALGIGLVAFGLWWLRELWRRHFGRSPAERAQRPAAARQGPRGVIEGEFVVVEAKTARRQGA